MKSTELKTKDKATLEDMLSQKREAIRVVRFGTAGSKSRNVKESRNLRKEVARIMTAINSIK